jgi:HemY protein
MIKLILSLGLLLALVFGLAELADMPGHILIDVAGMEIRLNLVTGLAALVGIILVTMVIWWMIRVIFRLPGFLRLSSRLRRRANGQAAISRGFIALGTGDERAARRYAEEAMRLLGREPLPLLLKAQAAQLAGDGKGAQSAFRTMLETEETASLGLRGLFIEAERQGDAATARQMAEEALRKQPATPWANAALLGFYAQARDWAGAIRILDQSISRRLVDRETGRAQRAILLAAAAQDQRESNPDEASTLAQEALRFTPGLVPAAVIAAQRFSAQGSYAKAAKILETAWKLNPHPDLADAYTHVRPGDAARDRLSRAKTLQKLSSHARESRFAVARAALDAQDFALARRELDTLLLEKPTTRACLLMAELEERESGNPARARAWLARAARAKRDPVWMADGVVSAEWAATSPVTGRIGAFEWRDPPEIGTGMLQNLLEEDREPLEAPQIMPAAASAMLIDQSPAAHADEPAQAPAALPSPASSPAPSPPPVPAIIPDDPGPEEGDSPPKKRRFGLF